ncbi:DUF1707 domain-containing protein [Nonomuraea sp. B12E4]|uniref:DUF1707 SHOCT-like domain-containing protein n=1 Tax=Nonomuraea sp. B12E4 TaxID=3153564 RepID=UPI00325E9B7F
MAPLVRASDADRDRTVQRLQVAFAEGRLTAGELELRLERALTERSHDGLRAVTSDLPDGPGGPAGDLADDTVRLRSKGGSIVREGEWRVPRLLRIDSKYGKVRLDLSRAHFPHSEVDIELRLPYGSATIILPAGASADVDGVRTKWGSVKCEAARTGRPHVRLTGDLAYGDLTIRTSRG